MDSIQGETITLSDMSGLRLSKGTQIGQLNLYHGYIVSNSDIPVAYQCHTEGDENLQKWHDMGLKWSSPYILRVIGSAKRDKVNQVVLVTEFVEESLQSWVDTNPLLVHGSLNSLFRNYLRDILKGMAFLRFTHKHPHGNFFEGNVFLSDGIAKLANVLDKERHSSNSFEDEIKRFSDMVERLFKRKGDQIPVELDNFCRSLERNRSSESYFRNSINHPSLLSATDRGRYRHIANSLVHDSKVLSIQKLDKNIDLLLRKANLLRPLWTSNIFEPNFQSVLTYSVLPQTNAPNIVKYNGRSSMDFLRFCRNSGEHVR